MQSAEDQDPYRYRRADRPDVHVPSQAVVSILQGDGLIPSRRAAPILYRARFLLATG